MTSSPSTTEEVAEVVRSSRRLHFVGGGTKRCLPGGAEAPLCDRLSLRKVEGVIEYEPGEYVFSARAGTPMSTIRKMLEDHGQYLPFDPPFVDEGSTLGGMVASGLNGPGRLRYGGIRDFLIGLTFVNGEGRILRGGGKVVKNAAGFDLPKFLVGSLGNYGVFTQLTFKVFPKPETFATVRFECDSLAVGLEVSTKIIRSRLEPDAVELLESGCTLARFGGTNAAIPRRAQRVLKEIGVKGKVLEEEEAEKFWREAAAFGWSEQGAALLKVPVTPDRILALDGFCEEAGSARRYGSAGNICWLSWPEGEPTERLDDGIRNLGLNGLAFGGGLARVRYGSWTRSEAMEAVRKVFDPENKFGTEA